MRLTARKSCLTPVSYMDCPTLISQLSMVVTNPVPVPPLQPICFGQVGPLPSYGSLKETVEKEEQQAAAPALVEESSSFSDEDDLQITPADFVMDFTFDSNDDEEFSRQIID